MKKYGFFVAALAAGMAMTSCNNDENVENIALKSSLNVENVGLQGLNSRAGITAESFTNGESLGLYIYETAGTSADLSTTVKYGSTDDVNIQYTLGADSKWAPANLPIVLSSKSGSVYAVYPYDAANTNPAAIAIKVAEDQGDGQSDGTKDDVDADDNIIQHDYMWADVCTGVSNATEAATKVDLVMNHALAMVTFKFKQADATADAYPGIGNVTEIKLFNADKTNKPILAGDATLNIADGTITGAAASENGITIAPVQNPLMGEEDEAKLARMLVYPTGAFTADEAFMSFKVDDSKYTLNIPALTDGYKAGNNYIYTLTMKGTKLTVESVTINKWIDTEGGAGDIQTPDAN